MSEVKNILKAKSLFRSKGIKLTADKQKEGGGGAWKFAGEDNLLKTIQKPLVECGLEVFTTMKFHQELGVDTIQVTLFHIESGESISSSISMPTVKPRKDRNENEMYLDAEIERGKQFGYWSRTLTIRILGLSDIDPEDINNIPDDLSKEGDRKELIKGINDFVSSLDEVTKEKTIAWILKTAKVAKVEDMPYATAKTIAKTIKEKQNANTTNSAG